MLERKQRLTRTTTKLKLDLDEIYSWIDLTRGQDSTHGMIRQFIWTFCLPQLLECSGNSCSMCHASLWHSVCQPRVPHVIVGNSVADDWKPHRWSLEYTFLSNLDFSLGLKTWNRKKIKYIYIHRKETFFSRKHKGPLIFENQKDSFDFKIRKNGPTPLLISKFGKMSE